MTTTENPVPVAPAPPGRPADKEPSSPRTVLTVRTLMGTLLVALLAVVLVVVLYPILRLLWQAFLPAGSFTVEAFDRLWASRGFGKMIGDTAVYVTGTLVLSTLIGGFLAWAMERTDARIDKLAGVMPIIPLLVPPIGSVLGYLTLFDPQSGYANIALRSLFSLDADGGPISVTNFPSLIFITAVNLAPMSYLIISSSLRNSDGALDEAARVSGAGRLRTFAKVTLPTTKPAIMSSGLMIGILAVGAFTYPFFIGTSAGVTTASVFVFRGFASWPPQQDVAIALSVLLTVVVEIAVLAQRRLATSDQRVVIAGKRTASSPMALGRWRWVVRALVGGYLLAVLVPIVALVFGSFLPYRGAAVSFANLSLQNYTDVLSSPVTRSALTNSFLLGAAAALLTMLAAASLVYAAANDNRRGKWIEAVLYAPSAIPQTALAAAFIVSFAGPPFNLYGTAALLVLAYVTTFLPQGAAASSSAVSQLNKQLVEAAYVSGASPLRTAYRVIVPQLVSGLFAGWVIVFFMAVNEVTISALLAGINVPVIGQVSVEYFDTGRVAQVGAMSVLVTAVAALVVAFTYRTVSKTASTGR